MSATILTIQARQRAKMSTPASLQDFTVQEGESIDASFVVDSPTVSLHCLDEASQRAIFVELPPGCNPAPAAFFYLAQFEQAVRLIAVDYADFHHLAAQIQRNRPPLSFIHNIGRCGSTLLHKILNQIDNQIDSQIDNQVVKVVSLSEPDALSQLYTLRTWDGKRDSELTELLQSSVRFLFKPSTYPACDLGVIKLRNQCLSMVDLFYAAFPDARHLFLYRSALGWIGSLYSRRQRFGAPQEIVLAEQITWWEQYLNRPVALAQLGLKELPATITALQQLTISWLMMLDLYLQWQAQGLIMPSLRYEELNTHPTQTLTKLFAYLNIPALSVANVLKVFAEDSQAGTGMARAKADEGASIEFSAEELAQVDAILSNHPTIHHTDYLTPGLIF